MEREQIGRDRTDVLGGAQRQGWRLQTPSPLHKDPKDIDRCPRVPKSEEAVKVPARWGIHVQPNLRLCLDLAVAICSIFVSFLHPLTEMGCHTELGGKPEMGVSMGDFHRCRGLGFERSLRAIFWQASCISVFSKELLA